MEDSSGSQPVGNVRASWLSISLSRPVVLRACGFMVVVGGVLIAINHGDAILRHDIDGVRALKMFLTPLVPYLVSTHSSVLAIRSA